MVIVVILIIAIVVIIVVILLVVSQLTHSFRCCFFKNSLLSVIPRIISPNEINFTCPLPRENIQLTICSDKAQGTI
ncbi:hypothetical protein D3C80_2132530 [compost metagenome]